MMIPQIVKIYVNKDASTLAFSSWFMFMLISVVWIIYGFAHKEKAVIFANCAWIIAYVFTLVPYFVLEF